MPRVSTQTTEKRAGIPELPSYLIVGTPERSRSSRTKIGPELTTIRPELNRLRTQLCCRQF